MEENKDKCKVSVIIPNYNNGKYLEECLNSVLNQTLEETEIIVIDDCSTDNSMEVLESFQTKHPEKIKVIKNKENSGAGLSRNNGLDIATGEFIKFLDADDTMDVDVLESMYNAAKEQNVKIVAGQLRVIGAKIEPEEEGNEKTGKRIDISSQREELVFGSAGIGDELFSQELFADIRFPKLKWEDFATIPAIKVLANDIYEMNKVVYNYRVHDTSTTSTDINKKTPRIFDIVECLHILREKIPEDYKEELDALEVMHYGVRLREIASWQDCSEEHKKTLINSMQRIMELEVPDHEENKYIKKPEENGIQMTDYLLKEMLEQDMDTEEIFQHLEDFKDNETISEMIARLKDYKNKIDQSVEIEEPEETELIKSALSAANEAILSEEYSDDDKKMIVTSLYQLSAKFVPDINDKISAMRQGKKKSNNKSDDDRYKNMGKKVDSYLEDGYITSDSVEEILENVQMILTSEEFLKYSMARTAKFVLQDETIMPEDIRNCDQYEKDNLEAKVDKGVEVND